ncbi:MAG: trehalose-phosphatase [Phycisphaerae bacterium]|nr:trehalose-phosphatase [Phycisphaerae bacterium]
MTHPHSDIVRHVASTPILLVASDFDGTLAPLIAPHDRAAPDRAAMVALTRLSRIPHTHVGIVSGRGLADLRARLGAPARWELSGSHGAEVAGEADRPMPGEARAQLRELAAVLGSIAAKAPGCMVEAKPRGVAFHYREVADEHAGSVVGEVTALAARFPALVMRFGSMVVEFLADRITKADGLRTLRHRTGATATIFIGDDLTDEHAFASLSPSDAGVKVGQGDSRAQFRVGGVEDVARLLALLAEEREAWALGRSLTPITAHAVLSDQRTLALVTPAGRVTWLCVPRIDSPPIFAELLGGPGAGYFEVAPVDPAGEPAREYDSDSLVLRTRWGTCCVTDYLDCGGGRAFQRAGRTDLIRVIEGTGTCRVRFAPRLDFGRVATRLAVREHGLEVQGSSDPILLYAPGVRWRIGEEGPHQSAEAEVDPSGGPIVLELRAGSANDRPHFHAESQRRQATQRFWSTWAGSLRLPKVATEQVRRSALMLRALVYGPTGAIAAAGTTSLPEQLGGQRNWDYRYCWPRDAAMTAAALVRLGNTGTAMRLLDWLARVLERCESPGRLRPIYTVEGRDLGPEAEIGGLSGYGGSRPVRVGNAAALQVQLDVFGPITDLIALLAESGAPISPDHWRLTRAMVEAVEARWQEPDHGIWEIRGERQHHVHSKVMCFHTVDRALVVHDCVIGRPNPAWEVLRDTIRADTITRGYNGELNTFTGTYHQSHLDAAALSVGLTGLLDVRDPRFVATVDAVDTHLRSDATVYRYRHDDGLPGREGGFHLCTGWLIEALALTGRLDRACELFAGLARSIGPTGVMSEQVDAELDMPLGNVPQAYSHLALINAALTLERLGAVGDSHAEASVRRQNGARS